MPNLTLQDQTTEFLLYTAPNGKIKVEVLLSNETIWLTQKRMAELFGEGCRLISKPPENIYDSGELQREATISILETVQKEGSREVHRRESERRRRQALYRYLAEARIYQRQRHRAE